MQDIKHENANLATDDKERKKRCTYMGISG